MRQSGNSSSFSSSRFQVGNAWSWGPVQVTISGFCARTWLDLGGLTVRFLFGGVDQDQTVIDGGVEHGGEQDVDLGDSVG